MEINPITQSCKTISGKHHFAPIPKRHECGMKDCDYTGMDSVYGSNGKRLMKCSACDLVDDLYEGKYS